MRVERHLYSHEVFDLAGGDCVPHRRPLHFLGLRPGPLGTPPEALPYQVSQINLVAQAPTSLAPRAILLGSPKTQRTPDQLLRFQSNCNLVMLKRNASASSEIQQLPLTVLPLSPDAQLLDSETLASPLVLMHTA